MARRFLLNLLLAVVAISLALFIFLKPDPALDADTTAISGLNPETISSIRLTRLQAEPLALDKRDGQWFIEHQPELPADDFQVNTLLSLPNSETDRHYPADTLDLKSMGLLPPQASAVLDNEKFDIGITDPLDKHRYVQAGTTVHLVSDRFQHLLNARFTNFVERRLLPADTVITGLLLPGLALRLGDDNHWLLQPEKPDISADTIRALISAWENSRALYVRDYDGSSGEIIRIQLQNIDEPIDLLLLTQEPEIILARPGWGIQYHLTSGAGSVLLELNIATDQ